MILNVSKCPACDGTSFAVEVRSWVNIEAADDNAEDWPHFDSSTAEFDSTDACEAKPIEGGDIICRDCGQAFKNTGAETAPATE